MKAASSVWGKAIQQRPPTPFICLVSTQGRAIDAAAKIRYDLTDAWYLTAGYRVFEGGVDNERFAFGWYNFALVSLGVRF